MKTPLKLLYDTLGDIKHDYLRLHSKKLLTLEGEVSYKREIKIYQLAISKISDEAQNSIDNKQMLQFPQDCKDCFFQHKCKNRTGVDHAYDGLECSKVWEHYRWKQ